MTDKKIVKSGDRALWDSYSGMVRIKIDSISGHSGLPSTKQEIEFTVTKDCGVYEKGEKHCIYGLHLVHKDSVRKRKYGNVVKKDFEIQAD